MKTLKLSTGERLAVNNLLNDLKGGLLQINMGSKIVDKMSFNEKEQKDLGMKQTFGRSGTPQLSWNIKKDKEKEIELSNDQAKLIKEQIQQKSDKGEFTLNDKYILQVAEKLEMEGLEEVEEPKEKKKK